MPSVVADIFRKAAALNRDDPRRRGNVVCLEADGELLVAGDLHGCRESLAKIIAHAALGANPRRKLVLQEIVHGPVDPRSGHDRSVEVLLRAVRLKVQHPEQVCFLMGNHDIAQLTGNEVLKDGRPYCKGFDDGVDYCFGEQAGEVREAIGEFLDSLPLAIRYGEGLLLCHSLPAPARREIAGVEILDRVNCREDMSRGGPLYEWTWGRGQTPEQIDALAARLGVEMFILGHQPCERGYQVVCPRCIILASDHERGCVLTVAPETELTADALREHIRPIAAVGRPKGN